MELPISFTTYTRTLLGDAEADKLFASLEKEQPVSIRLNKLKVESFIEGDYIANRQLTIVNSQFPPVPWCTSGFYLYGRLTFTFDPLFHAGCYYVQEASSMFVEQALRQHVGENPVVMLDLCAAPGGKSTHARSVLPEGSLLVANEVIRNRSQILAENLMKWGHPDVVVTNNEPADFVDLENFFDVILTDVPCSGEGMFRKDPVAVSEWSEENVEICWRRQRRIIADIWPSLKPGGTLIYSTCTYNTKEDEENIRWIRDEFGAEVLPLDVPADWHITGNLLQDEDFPVYRFLPYATRGEGFFLAVLRKPNQHSGFVNLNFSFVNLNSGSRKVRDRGGKNPGIPKERLSVLQEWLLAPDEYELIPKDENVSAFPKKYLPVLLSLQSSLRVVQAGINIAQLKGKDWIPHHALAMSLQLKPGAFPREEVSYEQAIAYLRKEAVILSNTASCGVILLTYKNVPLGFVKNIGNRANNLYPQEWRIRSGYLPETVKILIDD